MRALLAAAVLACACAYPAPRAYYPAYPYYNMDAVSMGGEGATVLSRYYQPYTYQQRQPYWSGGGGSGMAAFMYGGNSRANEFTPEPAAQRYPTLDQHERVPPRPASAPELEEVTESTPRVTALLFTDTEDAEVETPRPAAPAPNPARRLQGKKRAKKPTYDEVDDEETHYQPQPPAAYFPMFFGYGGGGKSGNGGGGGMGGGATAIANAYSTGRGGVATSHATAYGRPDTHK